MGIDNSKVDRAFEEGARDGRAGADRSPPHGGIGLFRSFVEPEQYVKEDQAYERGHKAGTKNR